MGNKIIKVKDEISHDGDLYTIEDIGSKKRITYSPNEIVQEGTEVGADLLNSFQENLIFKGDANRITEGQNEVFVSDISGYSEYGEFDLVAQINFSSGNTTETPILRIEQNNYSIVVDVFGVDSTIPVGVLQGLKTIRIRSGKAYVLNYDKSLKTYIDNNSGRKPVGYIQDAGNKIAGELYEDKLTTGLFRCIKSGNINYNSSEYFENDSNYALSDKLQNLHRIRLASTNKFLGSSGVKFGETILTLNENLFEYNSLEFHFITPGADSTHSVGVFNSPLNYRFAVSAIGSIAGSQDKRRTYSVVFEYNDSTKELKLGFCSEKPEVHLTGIFGYKSI